MQFHQLITEEIKNAENHCIALLGGGGKTALLHKLADEYSQSFPAVLQTSLTKTAFHKSDKPLILNEIDIVKLDSIKLDNNPLFIIGEKLSDNKLKGISENELNKIREYFNVTIFECDGARNKPLKAHTDYDPTVPNFTTHVIIIIGAEVIKTKINDGFVHRPELFCKTWNVNPELKLDIDFIVNVLTSQKGYLSKVSHETEITYFVNKWDIHQKNAEDLALAIHKKTNNPTFYGSVSKNILEKVH